MSIKLALMDHHAGLGLRDPNALKALVMQALRHHYPKLVI